VHSANFRGALLRMSAEEGKMPIQSEEEGWEEEKETVVGSPSEMELGETETE